MPWNDQRGGGRGPWGQGPQGGGGGGGIQPPNLDEVLRQIQTRLKRFLPAGGGNGMILGIAGGAAALLWIASGVNVIQATERGVVLRLGQYVDTLSEGFHVRYPYPIETVERVQTSQRQLEVGTSARTAPAGTASAGQSAGAADETLMLTGDENIVDIDFSVQWRVKDARAFAFNVDQPERTIFAVAESAMREVAGQSQINAILTGGRAAIQERVRQTMQAILDTYNSGVEVLDINVIKSDPPSDVIEAFQNVQAAAANADKARNEAERYKNSEVPKARGLASQIIQQAEAYKAQVVAEAEGEAARFDSIFEQYRTAPSVTRERMFLETMERVLGPMNKIVIDGKGAGAQPYLALPPELLRRAPAAPAQ
jgi:membrane protease subunit HflK